MLKNCHFEPNPILHDLYLFIKINVQIPFRSRREISAPESNIARILIYKRSSREFEPGVSGVINIYYTCAILKNNFHNEAG